MRVEVKPEHKPFIEGVVAKLAGHSHRANPYNHQGSQDDYDLWAKGWHLTPQPEDLI